ncbi:MAG: sulfite reductase [Alphaproteobacteria bacterium MedPE-SWcel]|nr:MAG: sulfite reductase [Alphaproteobacteria bacterium MedPE-SWcel]
MPRAFTPKVVTANDLLEGDVIYLTPAGGWTRELSEAELITDEAEAQLRLLDAQSQPKIAVGAYLADAKAGEQGPEPTHFREEFRRTGPSNYRHGKQEAAANV